MHRLLALIDAPFQHAAEHTLRAEASAVEDFARHRRVRYWAVARVAAVLVVTLGTAWALPMPMWLLVAWPFLIYMAYSGAGATYFRASAYRSGYLRGRLAMMSALTEADRRGLSLEDWLQGEIERDQVILFGDLLRRGDDE